MLPTMTPAGQFLLLLSCCLLNGRLGAGSGGPIFINPSAAAAASPPSASQGAFVTQTVYGFLDFTTTIGNTVMVFSPQSAAADGGKDKTTEAAINAVIDTKPTTAATQAPPTIKPSKTQAKAEKKASEPPKKISTVVNVQSNAPAPISTKVEIKAEPSTRVNVIEGVSSVVNVAPIVSSKVEVVAVPASKAPVSKTSVSKAPVSKAPVSKAPQQNIITKVEVITGPSKVETPPVISTRVEVYEGSTSSSTATPPTVVSSVVEIHSKEDEPAVVIGNNIGEPEYDFLSRQPSEVVEETYKVINLKPSSKFHLKPRPSVDAKNRQHGPTHRADTLHPTGLVTKLGGTVVKDGVTTVHETSVIGTYISGKYAQVLQSTSHIHHNHQKGKINPSPTLRILKTAAPALGKANKHHHLEPTPASSIIEETALPVENLFNSQNSIRPTRKPTGPGSSFKQRFKNRAREQEIEDDAETTKGTTPPPIAKKGKSKPRPSQTTRAPNKQHTTSHRPHKRNKKHGRKSARLATVSVHSEPPPTTTTTTTTPASSRKYQNRKNKPKVNVAPLDNNSGFTRRGYKPRAQVQAAPTEQASTASTSVYKFKLNRTPGRWQYKTTPKPRIIIRKQNEDDSNNTTITGTGSPPEAIALLNDPSPQARSDEVDSLVGSESVASIIDDESSTENKIDNPFPLETIKVEISTPPDFKDIYYEIATIKSPYTFQVGSVKNTRYITVTSTFEKSLDSTAADNSIAPSKAEPLTENILATSNNYEKEHNFLDSSIATLPPLYMAADMETPPLETMTETFSTTQTMLKTHILPAVRGGNETSSYTLVQTYLVTRLVAATKTLPPMDAYHFVPSKTLNEFNSHLDEAGSELNLELAFGDENDNEADGQPRKAFPADLDLANIGSDFDLSDVDKSNIPAEVHLRSKKAHVPTTPKPALHDALPTAGLSPEQLQQLALLRLLNPAAAQGQVITTSKPVVKVETVYESHVIPIFNGQNTILTTISKVLGTVTKTDYEFGTSTLAPALPNIPNIPNIPNLPNLPIPPVNPLFQQQQQHQFAVTTSPIVQTTLVTETSSKILKLTFGAKTAYTTILSTKVVPTVLTTYMTGSVPVQPTAAFPGFFPAPYPAFPYVG